jgi:hypothetical protein
VKISAALQRGETVVLVVREQTNTLVAPAPVTNSKPELATDPGKRPSLLATIQAFFLFLSR